jgi:antitoxin HigA-1
MRPKDAVGARPSAGEGRIPCPERDEVMRTTFIMRITSEAIMKMHNPPHPGEVLKTLCLEPLNLTVTEAARSLGVSRKTLSGILNGRAGISPEMAVRLSIAFNTSAESWLNQQVQYDLWHAERGRKRLHVRQLVAA